MPNIEISNELFNQFTSLKEHFNFPSDAEFIEFCLDTIQGRYWLAVSAIVTRDDEILMVGNDYGKEDLVWNLPGGAVDLGEDLLQAVARELHEETGITALEIGPLSWVVQGVLKGDRPFIIVFAFEITAWEGEVSVNYEVDQGDVQQAKFVLFEDAVNCMIPGNQAAFRDWLEHSNDIPRIYFNFTGRYPEDKMKIEHIAIWTKDLEQLKDFYITYFDAQANEKYVNLSKGFDSYFLSFASGARLELMSNAEVESHASPPESPVGLTHLAFSVGSKDRVDSLTQEMMAAGISVASLPRSTGDGYYESVILDPDGNQIEITI